MRIGLLIAVLCLPLTALGAPRLSVECPDSIARLTWDALSRAIRDWRLPDVEVDVVCRVDGSGRIETRLRGQRAIADLPPIEFGGPDRIVEIAEVQVDALVRAMGGSMAPPPRWVLRVGLGARVVGPDVFGGGLAFRLDHRFGRLRAGWRGVARLGLDAGLAAAGPGGQVDAISTSGLAVIGVRRAWNRMAMDMGLGMRAGWAVLEGSVDGVFGRAADGWYGPTLEGGVEWPFNRKGAVRMGLELGYSFSGPVLAGLLAEDVRHDGGWVGLDVAIAMAF